MIVLDSDHLSILQRPESPKYEQLLRALNDSADSVVTTTVISLEEQTRGWLAAINRARDVQDQPKYYYACLNWSISMANGKCCHFTKQRRNSLSTSDRVESASVQWTSKLPPL
jgi:hypothetical protein